MKWISPSCKSEIIQAIHSDKKKLLTACAYRRLTNGKILQFIDSATFYVNNLSNETMMCQRKSATGLT